MDTPETVAMIDWYKSWDVLDAENAVDPEWQRDNLEYDLRSTDWILEKVRSNEVYAQHLYAALCNNDFAKTDDVFKILKEQYWSCSWRHSGAIVANMRQEGDYIDWYLSGPNETLIDEPNQCYISPGTVTDEIEKDLEQLGWIVILNNEE